MPPYLVLSSYSVLMRVVYNRRSSSKGNNYIGLAPPRECAKAKFVSSPSEVSGLSLEGFVSDNKWRGNAAVVPRHLLFLLAV